MSAPTPLARQLAERIAATGPITLSEFMTEALLHPTHGYYTTRDPLGAGGDFTTAPEITQMFGELVGLALAQCWLDQGAPAPFTLAELGPGRGTLMADLWRATARVPGFHDAAGLHLVEVSAPLRQAQASRLADARPTWCDAVTHLPDATPLLVVANEFLDALPIRQFCRDARGWRECMVTQTGGALSFSLGPAAPLADLDARLVDTVPGDRIELRPALGPVIAELAQRIAQGGGAALIFDYGGWRTRGDTLQAVAGHAPVDPLAAPGAADLTAHVDFEAVAQAARQAGAEAWGPEPQGAWLLQLGLGERTAALARAIEDPAQRENHLAAYRRLTEEGGMGTVFKAMAITPKGAPPPAGFAARAPAAGSGAEPRTGDMAPRRAGGGPE